MATKMMIGNLPPGTTGEEVREELVRIGAPVLEVEMVKESGPDKLSAIARLDLDWKTAKVMEDRRKPRYFKGRRIEILVLTEGK